MRKSSHYYEHFFSSLWVFFLIGISIVEKCISHKTQILKRHQTYFYSKPKIVEIIGKILGNSLKIRVEYYPPHLKINEKKRLLNKQELIKEISIKETGRTGQFAKIETKHLKNNKIEEENTKKQEEKRSISLSRTWYMVVSVFIIVNSSLVFWET